MNAFKTQTNKLMPWLTATIFLGLLPACGTQTGNPPTGKLTPKLMPSMISSLMSLAYRESVDAMNTGDYGYSKTESRVINRLKCQNSPDGFSLVKKAETEHSVRTLRKDRDSLSNLKINRAYTDRWSAGTTELPCDAKTGLPTIDLTQVTADSALVLESDIFEYKTRSISSKIKGFGSSFEEYSTVEKEGSRTVSLYPEVVIDTGKDLGESPLMWTGQVYESLDRNIELSGDSDEEGSMIAGVMSSSLNVRPLAFEVAVNPKTKLVTSYRVKQQKVEYWVADRGVVSIEFSDVMIRPAEGCFPHVGKITTQWLTDKQSMIREWVFKDGEIITDDSDDSDDLIFTPEACVLNES